MQFSEGRLGRIFILRLEEGERLNDSIEKFAREQKGASTDWHSTWGGPAMAAR